jgi:hypothetical protein
MSEDDGLVGSGSLDDLTHLALSIELYVLLKNPSVDDPLVFIEDEVILVVMLYLQQCSLRLSQPILLVLVDIHDVQTQCGDIFFYLHSGGSWRSLP